MPLATAARALVPDARPLLRSTVPRTRLFRVAAAVMALLTSVITPGIAYAHGRAHAHIAAEHAGVAGGAHDADHHGELADAPGHGFEHTSAPASVAVGNDMLTAHEFEPSSHDHAHGHPILSDATAPRADGHVVDADIVAMPGRCVDLTQPTDRRDVCAAVRTNALLARPGPVSGPPPSPRAPPAR